MTCFHQHGFNRSLIIGLNDKTGIKTELIYDGYDFPENRPLITVEPIQDDFIILSKQRESVEVTRHYQIGLHEVNNVQLTINSERLKDVFLFEEFTYYNTLKNPAEIAGTFLCNLTAVVPMPSDDISQKSEYYRVYFDVEITNIKRRGI